MSTETNTGRVAVITGASSGIGAATARALAADGYRVALLARRIDRIQALADELGDGAIAIAADVTDRDSLLAAAQRVKDELGGADVLVNNAGVMLLAPFTSEQRAEQRQMVEVNLLGAMTATEVFLDQLRDGGGDLVNISSVAGRTARAGNAAYAATKWGINGWSEVAAPGTPARGARDRDRARRRGDRARQTTSRTMRREQASEQFYEATSISADDVARDHRLRRLAPAQRLAQRDPRPTHRPVRVTMSSMMERRAFLRLAVAGVTGAAAGVPLSACASASPDDAPSSAPARPQDGPILLAYFSRPGENYWYGGRKNLKVGNTQMLARTISARLDCDVHRIRAADPYSDDYDETVARNVREQDADARPDDRQSAAVDRQVRHDPAGQPDLERQGAHDHDELRRELRLLGKDRLPGHDARDERLGQDPRGLRTVVPRRAYRQGTRGPRREGPLGPCGRRRVAAPHPLTSWMTPAAAPARHGRELIFFARANTLP